MPFAFSWISRYQRRSLVCRSWRRHGYQVTFQSRLEPYNPGDERLSLLTPIIAPRCTPSLTDTITFGFAPCHGEEQQQRREPEADRKVATAGHIIATTGRRRRVTLNIVTNNNEPIPSRIERVLIRRTWSRRVSGGRTRDGTYPRDITFSDTFESGCTSCTRLSAGEANLIRSRGGGGDCQW